MFRRWLLLTIFICLSMLYPLYAQTNEDRIALFIPAFESSGLLGRNVATIINLQIWQTLRKAPYPNPLNLSFGRGLIIWAERPLSPQSHKNAERMAREYSAQFVLWGRAWQFGDGIIFQAYLTIPGDVQRETHPEIWKTALSCEGGNFNFEVDIPKRYYEFSPIILSPNLVEQYSTPNALEIYEDRSRAKVIGYIGNEFTARRQEGDYALVASGGETGWIYLPELSSTRSELVDFVGGIIRIFRGDWNGARTLLRRVIRNPNTSTALKIDAYLLEAIANEKQGKSGRQEIQEAFQLNPYMKTTAMYSLMSYLSELGRANTDSLQQESILYVLDKIEQEVASNKHLFSKADPWLERVSEAVDCIRLSGR